MRLRHLVSGLVLSSDKVIIVGDFNIHMDVDSDSLKLAFISLLESMGVLQKVKEPTHCFNRFLDLVLTYGIGTRSLVSVASEASSLRPPKEVVLVKWYL